MKTRSLVFEKGSSLKQTRSAFTLNKQRYSKLALPLARLEGQPAFQMTVLAKVSNGGGARSARSCPAGAATGCSVSKPAALGSLAWSICAPAAGFCVRVTPAVSTNRSTSAGGSLTRSRSHGHTQREREREREREKRAPPLRLLRLFVVPDIRE